MRVRGLKPFSMSLTLLNFLVAPHAGAWIETEYLSTTSVWIESHPMRVRGLKLVKLQYHIFVGCVAPHAGAWIETVLVH